MSPHTASLLHAAGTYLFLLTLLCCGLVAYQIEIVVKMVAKKYRPLELFYDDQWAWNWFDLFIVFFVMLPIFVPSLRATFDGVLASPAHPGSSTQLAAGPAPAQVSRGLHCRWRCFGYCVSLVC